MTYLRLAWALVSIAALSLIIDLPNWEHPPRLVGGGLNPQPGPAIGVGFGLRIKGPNAPLGAWEAGP